MRLLFLLFYAVLLQPLRAQQEDPAYLSRVRDPAERLRLVLSVRDVPDFVQWARNRDLTLIRQYEPSGLVVVEDRAGHFFDTTRTYQGLTGAEILPEAVFEESPVPGHNLFSNKIAYLHEVAPDLDGSGSIISIKESRFDSLDVDLRNRYVSSPAAAPNATAHAALMATLAAGAGNSGPAARGVARGSRVHSSDFAGLLPDAPEEYEHYDISVQNHSYGLDIDNRYSLLAQAYDVSTQEHPRLVHVFSAGNRGAEAAMSGPFAQLAGYANLSGALKMAKNILVVGASDSSGNVWPFSSHGPAYDGRIKPDLTAFGQNGTSDAAALVSGAAAVVRGAYHAVRGDWPDSELVRAILLASADETGQPGPDYAGGYGNLNLERAVRFAEQGFVRTGTLTGNTADTINLVLPPGIRDCRVVLAWNDPPALADAARALVNDLDLRLIGPGGSVRMPWVLSTAPVADSLSLPARPGTDSLNNLERVDLYIPDSGFWQIVVSAGSIPSGSQSWAIVAGWETEGDFAWTAPLRTNPLLSGKQALVGWQASLSEEKGALEWHYIGDPDWKTIHPEVELAAGFYRWTPADTLARVQLRMRTAGSAYLSDTLLVAPEQYIRLRFLCPDSLSLAWPATPGAGRYRLWGLGAYFMEPLLEIADTNVVLDRQEFPQSRFAVAVLDASGRFESRLSASPDISDQSVGCFINTLLAYLNDFDEVELTLSLGSLYGVRRIFLEKYVGQEWRPIHVEGPTGLSVSHSDPDPRPGRNLYRARLEMVNGGVLEGEPVAVFYPGASGYLVLPNPAPLGTGFTVLSTFRDEAPRFLLFDVMGKLVLEQALESDQDQILQSGLQAGCYVWVVFDGNGLQLDSGKLLVSP